MDDPYDYSTPKSRNATMLTNPKFELPLKLGPDDIVQRRVNVSEGTQQFHINKPPDKKKQEKASSWITATNGF
jgi:hypothetical protein